MIAQAWWMGNCSKKATGKFHLGLQSSVTSYFFLLLYWTFCMIGNNRCCARAWRPSQDVWRLMGVLWAFYGVWWECGGRLMDVWWAFGGSFHRCSSKNPSWGISRFNQWTRSTPTYTDEAAHSSTAAWKYRQTQSKAGLLWFDTDYRHNRS